MMPELDEQELQNGLIDPGWQTDPKYRETFLSICNKPPGLDDSKYKDLKSYHPSPGLKFKSKIKKGSDIPEYLEIEPKVGAGWLFEGKTKYVPVPYGYNILTIAKSDRTKPHARPAGWDLDAARLKAKILTIPILDFIDSEINKLPTTNQRPRAQAISSDVRKRLMEEGEEVTIRTLYLEWSTRGYDYTVHTCWKWID